MQSLCSQFWNRPPGGYVLFSDWNAEMALNAPKSVWMGWVGLESYKQSPFNWFCNQPQAGWVISDLDTGLSLFSDWNAEMTLTEPISVKMGCNMAKLVLMGIGIRQCSQISLTEPTYVGPDRTTLDCSSMCHGLSGLKNMPSILIFRPWTLKV